MSNIKELMQQANSQGAGKKVKGKGLPYSLPSAGPGADPGVQAVSPQVTLSHPPARPAVTLSITVPWPVPSYTAWWQRDLGVNNLPEVDMQLCPE